MIQGDIIVIGWRARLETRGWGLGVGEVELCVEKESLQINLLLRRHLNRRTHQLPWHPAAQ